MPKSRSLKRKPQLAPHPQMRREKQQPPLIRGILASWWARLIAGLGFLVTTAALAVAYGAFSPEVAPLDESSAPTEFNIKNNLPILSMANGKLVCHVENAAVMTNKGTIG